MIDPDKSEETINEEEQEQKPLQTSLYESALFVVNMMNEGNIDPKQVYPPGRYHGD